MVDKGRVLRAVATLAILAVVGALLGQRSAPEVAAQTFPCSANSIFGISATGIWEIEPIKHSAKKISGGIVGKTIAAGPNGHSLYATDVLGFLYYFDIATRALTLVPWAGAPLPAGHNAFANGWDSQWYVGDNAGGIYAVTDTPPPADYRAGVATNPFAGDWARDPTRPRGDFFGTTGAIPPSCLSPFHITQANPVTFVAGACVPLVDLATLSIIPDAIKGVAFSQLGDLYVSDWRPGVGGGPATTRIWWVQSPASGGSWKMLTMDEDLVDLASEPYGYCPPQSPPPPPPPVGDLGDAPDSTNHFGLGMTTYAGTAAKFPSVFDGSGPWGPKHLYPSGATLGSGWSAEFDADQMIAGDPDGIQNIQPPTNNADLDGGDDGLSGSLTLPHCTMTTFPISVTVTGSSMPRYISGWFDWNRDGDWGDVLQCTDPGSGQVVSVAERAVDNLTFTNGPGTYSLTTPSFRAYDPAPGGNIWLRLTLSESIIMSTDGRGPQIPYANGETEDYYLDHSGGSSYSP